MTDADRVLSAAAAVLAADLAADAYLVVLASDPALVDLCRAVHPGPVVAADDAVSLRGAIPTPTGRADAVVTTTAARAAVRAVRRGGVVCLPWAEVDAPSVTEVVQREVRLVSAPSLDALTRAYPDEVARCRTP